MTVLSSNRLLKLLVAATGGVESPSSSAPKPAVLDIPKMGSVRAYLWTVTQDRSASGRPKDEHKSQIILPDSKRGDAQILDVDDMPTFLMGYSPLYGVFVFWEARLHVNSAWSKNLQVKEGLLEEASRNGWAIDDPRRTASGMEVRAAVHAAHVVRFMSASIEADRQGLTGVGRQAFLEAFAPELDRLDGFESYRDEVLAGSEVDLPMVMAERGKASYLRFVRSKSFSTDVLSVYGHMCAVCGVQMTILEGAHILPVHHPQSVDEVWNGIALCRNHHALYDKKIMLIDGAGIIRVNDETIAALAEMGRAGGYNVLLEKYKDRRIQNLPEFFGRDKRLTGYMKSVLRRTYKWSPE